MAANDSVKGVLLHHWYPTDPATYLKGVAKYFRGLVFGTQDLQRYCLGATSTASGSGRSQLHLCD
jgi:hypothetical protein